MSYEHKMLDTYTPLAEGDHSKDPLGTTWFARLHTCGKFFQSGLFSYSIRTVMTCSSFFMSV